MQSMTFEAPIVNTAPALEAAPEIPGANPRDSWPAWTDAHTWEFGPEAPDETACPIEARPSGFAPSAEDEAYASGYALQFDHGIAADPPADWRLMRSSAFRLGQADGLLARYRREDLEDAAWVEDRERDAFGDPSDRIHDAERCGVC